jgi:hypothetical protein
MTQDAPAYVPGIGAMMAVLGLGLVLSLFTSFFLRRANKQADAGTRVIEKAVGFRYTW